MHGERAGENTIGALVPRLSAQSSALACGSLSTMQHGIKKGIQVLLGLLRKPEQAPQLVARTEAPKATPQVQPLISGCDRVRKPVAPARAQSRRRKPIRILDIYRDPVSKMSVPARHAAALFDLMKDLGDDHGGHYVPKSQLQRMYADECRRREWSTLHWTAIGRELSKLTDKRKVRRHGRRITVYRVPQRMRSVWTSTRADGL